ncbi:hypothetical protein D3C80_1076520 [compost metagenome]
MLFESGTSIVKLPSKSVTAVIFVPFTRIFTPGSGSPCEPVTFPFISFSINNDVFSSFAKVRLLISLVENFVSFASAAKEVCKASASMAPDVSLVIFHVSEESQSFVGFCLVNRIMFCCWFLLVSNLFSRGPFLSFPFGETKCVELWQIVYEE